LLDEADFAMATSAVDDGIAGNLARCGYQFGLIDE
jgi:hypothetical protein